MRRFIILTLSALMFGTAAIAQTYIPERREIITNDVDFYGSDLQALFDTTLDACRRTCLNTPTCQAYTFNGRSNSCFPKSDVTDNQPYDGAVSARILTTDPAILELGGQRAKELSFLYHMIWTKRCRMLKASASATPLANGI